MSVISTFNNIASSYDERNQKMASIKNNLHHLMSIIFSELKENSNILCVGAGTGEEILYLAKIFPNFQFTALDPSENMLNICKKRITEAGLSNRCTFHNGYLESFSNNIKYDGATSILVSQFILNEELRCSFFREIYEKLTNNGILINADLSCFYSIDTNLHNVNSNSAYLSSSNYETLIKYWVNLFNNNKATTQQINNAKEAYYYSVGILPANKVEELIKNSGFKEVTLFFQSLLMHAWVSKVS